MGVPGSGRRPKTVNELQQDGTYRKDRHEGRNSPEPTSGRPEPPAELDNLGQQTWDRMLWAFEDMGMLAKVDAEALYAYCRLWSETEQVREQQEEARAGLRVLEDNLSDVEPGDKVALFTQIVNLHKTVSKCTDQLRQGRMAIRQYLVEFGLTPASRGRIKLPAKKEKVDAFTAFQQQRSAIARVK